MFRTSNPLTIVHVVFSSRIAGGEQHCVDLANAQAALGHRVYVVGPAASAVSGALSAAVTYLGMSLPLMRGWQLNRLARKLGADVCHGHLGPACRAVAQARGPARIGTLHVGYKAHQHAALDGLICVNRAQQRLLNAYAGRVRVIHNWAPERTSPVPARDLRTELGLEPNQVLVGSVGRLCPSKGMDLLATAFKTFAPADAVLAILGEGKQHKALTALVGDDVRIKLLGFRPDVDAAMRAMDLFVSPSREDAFPLAILEAMRAGLPIIATRTQGPLEMLCGQPATMVPVSDINELGRAIQRSVEQLRTTPRAARPQVSYDLAPYDRDRAVQDVLDFYRQVMSQVTHSAATSLDEHSEDAAHA